MSGRAAPRFGAPPQRRFACFCRSVGLTLTGVIDRHNESNADPAPGIAVDERVNAPSRQACGSTAACSSPVCTLVLSPPPIKNADVAAGSRQRRRERRRR